MGKRGKKWSACWCSFHLASTYAHVQNTTIQIFCYIFKWYAFCKTLHNFHFHVIIMKMEELRRKISVKIFHFAFVHLIKLMNIWEIRTDVLFEKKRCILPPTAELFRSFHLVKFGFSAKLCCFLQPKIRFDFWKISVIFSVGEQCLLWIQWVS